MIILFQRKEAEKRWEIPARTKKKQKRGLASDPRLRARKKNTINILFGQAPPQGGSIPACAPTKTTTIFFSGRHPLSAARSPPARPQIPWHEAGKPKKRGLPLFFWSGRKPKEKREKGNSFLLVPCGRPPADLRPAFGRPAAGQVPAQGGASG